MKLKITLYSVCLLMLLAACQQDGPTPEPSVGSRTVLVYMIAQNSLAPLASADIEEMKEGMRQVDATSGNLLVYIDDYSAPRLIRLGKDKKGKVCKAVLVKLEPKKNEKTGRMMMTEVAGSEYTVDVDLVLIAAGFLGSQDYVTKAFGVEVNERTNVKTAPGKSSPLEMPINTGVSVRKVKS